MEYLWVIIVVVIEAILLAVIVISRTKIKRITHKEYLEKKYGNKMVHKDWW